MQLTIMIVVLRLLNAKSKLRYISIIPDRIATVSKNILLVKSCVSGILIVLDSITDKDIFKPYLRHYETLE